MLFNKKVLLFFGTCLIVFCMYMYIPSQTNKSKLDKPSTTMKFFSSSRIKQNAMKHVLQKRFPGIIGIGSKKCSTKALHLFFCSHPMVGCSRTETHFFDSKFEMGAEYYRSFFPPTTDKMVTFEKTPKYFNKKNVPQRIRDFYQERNQSVKFILSLCDPVKRAYSDFIHSIERLNKNQLQIDTFHTFDEYLDVELDKLKFYLSEVGLENLEKSSDQDYDEIISSQWSRLLKGIYSFHLKRWFKVFPKDDILIIDGDQTSTDPWLVLQKVQKFANLPIKITKENFVFVKEKGFYCLKDKITNKPQCLVASKGRTRFVDKNASEVLSKLSDKASTALKTFYQPYNYELYGLIDQHYNWM